MCGTSQRSRSSTLCGFLRVDVTMVFLRLRLTPASAGYVEQTEDFGGIVHRCAASAARRRARGPASPSGAWSWSARVWRAITVMGLIASLGSPARARRRSASSPSGLFWEAPDGLSGWLVWRRSGLWPATAPPTFFPGVCHAFLASQEARLPPSSAALRPDGASRPFRRLMTAIEAALGGFENSQERRHGTDRHLHPRRDRRLQRNDQDPHHQRQGQPSSPATATTTKRPTTGSPPTASSSAPGGARPPARREPNTSR